MVDDHRQYYANLIARWAEDEGDGPFFLTYHPGPDANWYEPQPNHMAYRLADIIVSNPYPGVD
jgi:hypothetical protein